MIAALEPSARFRSRTRRSSPVSRTVSRPENQQTSTATTITTTNIAPGTSTSNSPHNSTSVSKCERYLIVDPQVIEFLEFAQIQSGSQSNIRISAKPLTLSGFDLYIVEQWACERRQTSVIPTFTGDANHQITVAGFIELPEETSEPPPDFATRYFNELVKSHARVKDVAGQGRLFVYDISSFPSNLNLVPVPGGNVAEIWDHFIVNHNLRAVSCSGRSGLLLCAPSDASEDKFRKKFKICPDSTKVPIEYAVQELVLIIQIMLTYFGLLDGQFADGLLCNRTLLAAQEFWNEIGFKHYAIRVKDGLMGPTTVATIIGLVLSIRKRLSQLGIDTPKDPLDVKEFVQSILRFQKQYRLELTGQFNSETLDKLFVATTKTGHIGPNDIFGIRKAVKDISGKVTHCAADSETVDIDRMLAFITGKRLKFLFAGKGDLESVIQSRQYPAGSLPWLQQKYKGSYVKLEGQVTPPHNSIAYSESHSWKRKSTSTLDDAGISDSLEPPQRGHTRGRSHTGATPTRPNSGGDDLRQGLDRRRGIDPISPMYLEVADTERDPSETPEKRGKRIRRLYDTAKRSGKQIQGKLKSTSDFQETLLDPLLHSDPHSMIEYSQDENESQTAEIVPSEPENGKVYEDETAEEAVEESPIVDPVELDIQLYKQLFTSELRRIQSVPSPDETSRKSTVQKSGAVETAQKTGEPLRRCCSFSLVEDAVLVWEPTFSPSPVYLAMKVSELSVLAGQFSKVLSGSFQKTMTMHEHTANHIQAQYVIFEEGMMADEKKLSDSVKEMKNLEANIKELEVTEARLGYDLRMLKTRAQDVEACVGEFGNKVMLLEKAVVENDEASKHFFARYHSECEKVEEKSVTGRMTYWLCQGLRESSAWLLDKYNLHMLKAEPVVKGCEKKESDISKNISTEENDDDDLLFGADLSEILLYEPDDKAEGIQRRSLRTSHNVRSLRMMITAGKNWLAEKLGYTVTNPEVRVE